MIPRFRLMILALSLVAKSLCAQVPAPAAPLSPADRLRGVIAVNSLDTSDAKPWHLKLSVQTFDSEDVPTPAATIEAWWLNHTTHRIVYTTPAVRVEQLTNSSGRFASKDITPIQDLLDAQLEQVIHPMPTRNEIAAATVELIQHPFGNLTLDCLVLTQPIKGEPNPPFGLFPAYCLDSGKDNLLVAYFDVSQAMTRNVIGKFRGVNVGIETSIYDNDRPLSKAHVDALASAPLAEADFLPGPDLVQLVKPLRGATGVSAGYKTSGEAPRYPQGARDRHVSGTVVMDATIGRDGRVHRLRVVSTPDSELTSAAIASVKTYVYKPYLLNGVPCDVNTVIKIQFHL